MEQPISRYRRHLVPARASRPGCRANCAKGAKKIWLTNSQTDSLTPVVQRMIGLDLIRVFLPYTNSHDRGQVLQDEWQSLQLEFARLQAGEQDGSRPSLIISPYLVDSGKPLFIHYRFPPT